MNTQVELQNSGYINENVNDKNVNGIFLANNEISIDISNISIKKYHRKRKGKRYLIYYYEEYSMFDDFIFKVFDRNHKKYKKYKKLGGKAK